MRLEIVGPGFSAAHFVVGHRKCEHLHGHNWGIKLGLEGEPAEDGMIVDFDELKELLKKMCMKHDHRVLVPGKNPELEILRKGKNAVVQVHGKKFEFPAEDVVVVPVENITVEELARYFLQRVVGTLKSSSNISKVSLWVEEFPGQGAWAEAELKR